jgi:hypothetical protein
MILYRLLFKAGVNRVSKILFNFNRKGTQQLPFKEDLLFGESAAITIQVVPVVRGL